jgi:two-component system phosphate regulon sensor histidine kinase PhoR
LDVGAIPVVASPVNLNAILLSLAQDRESLAARKGLKIALELEEDLPMVSGDERLLGQVFTNLLTNAMNYTPEGGRITLRTRTGGLNDRPGVTAEVEDTGIGIPAEEQEQIFHRFYRGRASRSTGAPGTGLGLAICAEIIERHNGEISVVSGGAIEQGSRFIVQIPTIED